MKRLIVFRLLSLLLISLLAFSVSAQEGIKQVAIYVARENGDQKMVSYAKFFASELQLAVSRSGKYNAVERTGKFLELLSKEQSYQRTGQVDESKIAELGKQEKVDYVLSVDMTDFGGNNIYVVWKLIDVESAIVEDGDSEIKEIVNMVVDLKAFSEALTKRITGGGKTSISNGNSGSNGFQGYGQSSGSDYTETAMGLDMQMVYVEGGDFMMGCTSEQGSDCADDEKPVHSVTLDSYYIGRFEVTQGQWEKVMGTSIYQQKSNWGRVQLYGAGTDYPMYYVSWEEATAFCEELSKRTGKKYRLPTEAQWEYAARGGNKNERTRYSGSSLPDAVVWHGGNSGGLTHPVGTKRSNILGLYDMSGNVWEWCRDWYSTYSEIPYFSTTMNFSLNIKNPQGPYSGTEHVVRGGSAGDWMIIAAIVAKSAKVEMKRAIEVVAEEVSKGLSKEEYKEELELMESLCRVAFRMSTELEVEDEEYDVPIGFRVVCEPDGCPN